MTTLATAIKELNQWLDLPAGVTVWAQDGAILVGNSNRAFCILPKHIEAGWHLDIAKEALTAFIETGALP